MLPTALRERSRIFREAARKARDAGAMRRLAAHALALAQAAEAAARDKPDAKMLRYLESLLARRVDEDIPRAAPEPPQKAHPPRISRSDITAWRLRAEELRATAAQFAVPSAQDALCRAAANYDQLADHAEALLARHPAKSGKRTG